MNLLIETGKSDCDGNLLNEFLPAKAEDFTNNGRSDYSQGKFTIFVCLCAVFSLTCMLVIS